MMLSKLPRVATAALLTLALALAFITAAPTVAHAGTAVTQCPVAYGYNAKGSGKVANVTNFGDVFGRLSYGGDVLQFPGAQGVPVRFTLRAGQELRLRFDVPADAGAYDFSLTNGAVAGPAPLHIDAKFVGSDKTLVSHDVMPGAFALTWRTPGGIRRAAPYVLPGQAGVVEITPLRAGDVWLVYNYTRR